MILKSLCNFLILMFLISCAGNSSKNDEFSKQLELEAPETLYDNAMLMFEKKQYEEANKIFINIERIYPLSNEAIQSQIMQGFIDYMLLDYDSGIMKFTKIIKSVSFDASNIFFDKLLLSLTKILIMFRLENSLLSFKEKESDITCIVLFFIIFPYKKNLLLLVQEHF